MSFGNQSVDPSTLALTIVSYNHVRDAQTETNNIEVAEDHIDVNSNNSAHANFDDSFRSDIFDPWNWDFLDSKQIDILAQKGPKIDLPFKKGPKNTYRKRSTEKFYTRALSNGGHCDRDWLVYSKELDKVFFALVVNYLQKVIGKVSWQMRILMIGHIWKISYNITRKV